MSHGSSEKTAEPNLVPLLDLVLQLVMFFMVCASFVMEQVNKSIQLPTAIAAKALDKRDEYIIFLNVTEQGIVPLSPLEATEDRKSLDNPIQVTSHMKRRFEEDLRATGGDRSKPPRSVVILRVDKRTPFEKTYAIMKAIRAAGYDRVQLRAIVGNEKG